MRVRCGSTWTRRAACGPSEERRGRPSPPACTWSPRARPPRPPRPPGGWGGAAAGRPADPRPLGVFLMCERLEILDRLHALEVRGIPLVNSPRAVLNTYRERMIALFDEANVAFIESRLVATDARNDVGALPVWVKRADVHNTQAGDVTFASTREGVTAALEALAARGIRRAVIQSNVEGDLVKFYGIGAAARSDGAPGWFRWFYHKEQRVAGHPFEPAQLARAVRRAALAPGLDIYRGEPPGAAAHRVLLALQPVRRLVPFPADVPRAHAT